MTGTRSDPLTILSPTTPQQIDAVRRLCWQYRDFLLTLNPESVRVVQKQYPEDVYARLMDRISEEHAPPMGAVRLAMKGEDPVGCGMVHELEPGIAEIKRVFVTDAVRGTGAGYAIMQSLVDHCRAAGYRMIRMDTGVVMKAAARLYLSMGFRLRDAYSEIPPEAEGHLLFFEMDL